MSNQLSETHYNAYVELLHNELIPALGCTEPIAIALAAAKAKEVLGKMPERIVVSCSSGIIKNAKSVIVPSSGGLKGIEVAACLGIVAGASEKGLEVLSRVDELHLQKVNELVNGDFCTVAVADSSDPFYILIEAYNQQESSVVEFIGTHTNISRLEKNGKIIFSKPISASAGDPMAANKELLESELCYLFAKEVNLEDISSVILQQVQMNSAIAEEGLHGSFGMGIGKAKLKYYGADDVSVRAVAKAAAGSDARMSGHPFPVVINSGSGNQGLTVSLPVIEYASHLNVSEEELIRALVLANLIALLQKRSIGSLSAYCGAVSAAAGAASGIAFLHGASFEKIANTITNTLANVGGIFCDGAKASCAAKIASALDAAIFAFHLGSIENKAFHPGDGLVKQNVDETIESIGHIGGSGMKEADKEILASMLEE